MVFKQPAVKGRRSSRRSSIIPSSPTQLEMPVKTSRPRASKVAERVLEDSEPEDDEPPKRPSVAFAPLEQPKHRDELEEGNFSDFNAFQSGGSSPDVKSRDKKIRRKVSVCSHSFPWLSLISPLSFSLRSVYHPPLLLLDDESQR